jgi:hypothetical protein
VISTPLVYKSRLAGTTPLLGTNEGESTYDLVH